MHQGGRAEKREWKGGIFFSPFRFRIVFRAGNRQYSTPPAVDRVQTMAVLSAPTQLGKGNNRPTGHTGAAAAAAV